MLRLCQAHAGWQLYALSRVCPVHDLQSMCQAPTDTLLLLQMRWYCMQFMMVQLADELQELYDAMSQVLAKLPRPDS